MSVNSTPPTLHSITRMETYFYDRGADLKITFSGGEEIKVNRELLAFHSAVFDKIFSEDPSKTELFVPDFDLTTFTLFLDCLMGFKPYTDLDSLLIFPIAHKYQSEKCIRKCIKALTPKEVNETVCHTLNLGIYYERQDLIDSVIDFIKEKFGIRLFLETEQYCFILEPISMAKLLQYVPDFDFSLLKKICDWAKNCMQNFKKSSSLASFFKEYNILDEIQKFRSESFQSIFDIRETEETKDLFTVEQILSFFKEKIAIENPRRFPNKSMWVMVKKGETLTENYKFAKPLAFRSEFSIQMTLELWTNEITFMDKCVANGNPVTCQITFVCAYNDTFNHVYRGNQSITVKSSNEYPIKKDGKYIHEIVWPKSTNSLSLEAFNITYTFNDNCKILKTSMEGILNNGSEILCYTYCIIGK